MATARVWDTSATNFNELLLSVPLSQHRPRRTTGDMWIEKSGPVACVQLTDSLPSAFKKLTVEGFTSAPVLDWGGTFRGFISLLDIVKYITELFYGTTGKSWQTFFDEQDTFSEATVEEVMKRSSRFKSVNTAFRDFSTMFGLEMLSHPHAYRIALVDADQKVKGILTQSMMISFIRQNMKLLKTLKNTQIWDLEAKLFKDVVSCNENDITINAFNKIIEKKTTGLAILDDMGVLVGNLSIKDLKGVGTSGESFSRLFLPVKTFKSLERSEYPQLAPRTHYSSKQVPLHALMLTGDNTFGDLINKMDDGNIHRVYIASKASTSQGKPKPANVITQTDVLDFVFQHVKGTL